MKMTHKIDHIKQTIAITKTFEKKANILHSDEYNAMLQLRNDNPTYKFVYKEIKKSKVKETHKGLTFDAMRAYIVEKEGEVAAQAFDKVKEYAKEQRGTYAHVKNWFLNKYKDYELIDTLSIERLSEIAS